MNSACTKAVGTGHCNIAFLPGLANYPTDTNRINPMTAYYKSKSDYTFTVMPPGQYDQTQSQSVAQTFFTAHKNINVFATFGDQMAQGTITALKLVGGYTPGQNIQIIGYGGAQEIVNEVKSGHGLRHPRPVPGGRVGARHPVPVRRSAREDDPEPGQHHQPEHPSGDHQQGVPIAHPNYVPDWNLEGGLGTAG